MPAPLDALPFSSVTKRPVGKKSFGSNPKENLEESCSDVGSFRRISTSNREAKRYHSDLLKGDWMFWCKEVPLNCLLMASRVFFAKSMKPQQLPPCNFKFGASKIIRVLNPQKGDSYGYMPVCSLCCSIQ